MNNIGRANIVILKRPIVEEVESDYKSYIYLITVTTWS